MNVVSSKADRKLRQVTDNIHGTIYLSELESEMISTPFFYRLHDIYQSSSVYITFPSNRTKRYEHSLGTMELAGEMFFSAVSNADTETKKELFNKRLTIKQLAEQERQHQENMKQAQEHFVEQLKSQKEEQLLSIRSFFTFDIGDIATTGVADDMTFDFQIENAGSDSDVNPKVVLKENADTGAWYAAEDAVNRIRYMKEPSNSEVIVEPEGRIKIKLLVSRYDGIKKTVDSFTGLEPRSFYFDIHYEDLVGTSYTQRFYLIGSRNL